MRAIDSEEDRPQQSDTYIRDIFGSFAETYDMRSNSRNLRLREHNYNQPGDARTKLRKSRIFFHDATRWFGVAASVAISQTIGAIGFPVIILSLIPLRWIVLTRLFTVEELDVLDAPTANADVILASFGGQPERPEVVLVEKKRATCSIEDPADSS